MHNMIIDRKIDRYTYRDSYRELCMYIERDIVMISSISISSSSSKSISSSSSSITSRSSSSSSFSSSSSSSSSSIESYP